MGREIRFRAWIVEDKYMMTWGEMKASDEHGSIMLVDILSEENEDFKVMQYTGLKDRNGKEIYEGDILTVENEGRPFVKNWNGVVKFIDGSYLIENMEGTDGEFLFDEMREVEVVGNVYENPELLEEK